MTGAEHRPREAGPVCAIIPARGGSKGIHRKNLVSLLGKPLICHSIEHALQSESVERVIVSTDDREIAAVATASGAEVPFLRPAALAEDHVLDYPVFEHALEWLRREQSYEPEIIVHLRPTAPLRQQGQIDAAVRSLIEHPGADSVRSVSIPGQHPYRMFEIGEDGFLQPLLKTAEPEPYLLRRQDLPPVYWYNCVIDVTRRATVLEKKSMTGRRIIPFIIDAELVVDIDSPTDLLIAEQRMRLYRDKEQP